METQTLPTVAPHLADHEYGLLQTENNVYDTHSVLPAPTQPLNRPFSVRRKPIGPAKPEVEHLADKQDASQLPMVQPPLSLPGFVRRKPVARSKPTTIVEVDSSCTDSSNHTQRSLTTVQSLNSNTFTPPIYSCPHTSPGDQNTYQVTPHLRLSACQSCLQQSSQSPSSTNLQQQWASTQALPIREHFTASQQQINTRSSMYGNASNSSWNGYDIQQVNSTSPAIPTFAPLERRSTWTGGYSSPSGQYPDQHQIIGYNAHIYNQTYATGSLQHDNTSQQPSYIQRPTPLSPIDHTSRPPPPRRKSTLGIGLPSRGTMDKAKKFSGKLKTVATSKATRNVLKATGLAVGLTLKIVGLDGVVDGLNSIVEGIEGLGVGDSGGVEDVIAIEDVVAVEDVVVVEDVVSTDVYPTDQYVAVEELVITDQYYAVEGEYPAEQMAIVDQFVAVEEVVAVEDQLPVVEPQILGDTSYMYADSAPLQHPGSASHDAMLETQLQLMSQDVRPPTPPNLGKYGL